MKATRSIKQNEIVESWYLIDAKGKRLGRVAQKAAALLIGKNKVNNVDYLNPSNKVIIINAADLDIFPSRLDKKKYARHSGYPGGFREVSLREMMDTKPEEVVEKAVWGMVPKNKMGRAMMTSLRIYKDSNYKEQAQKPVEIKLD